MKLSIVLFLSIIFPLQVFSQTSHFPFGTYVNSINTRHLRHSDVKTLGANTIVDYAEPVNELYMEEFEKSIAGNGDPADMIHNYTYGYYNKWEAEEWETTSYSGIKHALGFADSISNRKCWVTPEDIPETPENFIYGPNSSQERQYNYDSPWALSELKYHVNIPMILLSQVSSNTPVCKITVKYKYEQHGVTKFIILHEKEVMSDELSSLDFNNIEFEYSYYSHSDDLITNSDVNPAFYDRDYPIDDRAEGMGIEYKIDWFGIVQFAVDYIEIYDKIIMDIYINDRAHFINTIIEKASDQEDIDNLSFWHANDGPLVVDQYMPYRIVDTTLINNNFPPLITSFYPMWNNKLNGWRSMEKWVEIAQPKQFLFWYYPMWPDLTPGAYDNMDKMLNNYLKPRLQEAHLESPDFYYMATVMKFDADDVNAHYRKPEGTEFRAMVMLALSHGAKGIFFMDYYSYGSGRCDGLVGEFPPYTKSTLWYYIRDNIKDRINGSLGNTLLNLKYTGTSLDLDYNLIGPNPNPIISDTYFKLEAHTLRKGYHVGFLKHKDDDDIRYFFLTSKLVDPNHIQNCTVHINEDHFLKSYLNWIVKNAETSEFISFNSNTSASLPLVLQAGDGKLFCVAPSIKYGGEINVNETVPTNTSLKENELIIKSGATLTVSGNYNIYKNIIVEHGGTLLLSAGAHLNFMDGSQLILKGALQGIASARGTLNFNGSDASGVVINSPVTIENVILTNASTGISMGLPLMERSISEPNKNTIIKNVDFQTDLGIYAINYANLLVQNCQFNNSMGVMFTNIISFNIIGNIFIGNHYSGGWAINAVSSSGIIRNNEIRYYGCGLLAGSSNVELGNNQITVNNDNGLYLMEGTQADLRGKLIFQPGCPENLIYFPTCGFNNISDNCITDEFEGAEIIVNHSTIMLDEGYNTIKDDRRESFATRNLMDGEIDGDLVISARHNEWGLNPDYATEERFGQLGVIFEPSGIYLPDVPVEECNHIIVYANDGTIIDTVRAMGEGPAQNEYLANLYQSADEKENSEDYLGAEAVFKNIISIFVDHIDAQRAYDHLFEVYYLRMASPQEFLALRTYYLDKLSYITHEELHRDVVNLADRCLLYAGEIEAAISNYENIIDNYPGTEQAVVAEINLYAAALLDTSQSLGKEGKFGKVNRDNCIQKMLSVFAKNNKNNSAQIIPTEYMLFQNYPNPFNPSTNIKYAIKERAEVKLIVYDILGRVVKELVNEVKEPGYYDVKFNMNNYSSGVYFYSLQTKNYTKTNKMLLIK